MKSVQRRVWGILISLCIVVLFNMGCFVNWSRTERGSGHVIEETRAVGNFDSIDIEGVGDIFLYQGSSPSVTIVADDNFMPHIDTAVRYNTLYITKSNRHVKFRNIHKLEIHITFTDIDDLQIDGVGNVKGSNLSFQDLKVDFSGIGALTLSGDVDTLKLDASGIGDVDFSELIAKRLEVSSSGIGRVYVHGTESISINLSGIGDLTYRGEGEVIRMNVTGIGKVNQP